MPTAVGPNIKGEENLIFGFDLGDTRNSYKGEPATNYQNYDTSTMTQTGFDAWGCFDAVVHTPNDHYWGNSQSKTRVRIPGPLGQEVDAMLYHNFTGAFHGPVIWSGVPQTQLANGTTITVQAWVKAANATSVGEIVRPWLYYNKVGGGAYSANTTYTLSENWQLVSHTYTVPEGATGNGNFYLFTDSGSPSKMYVAMTAIITGTGHAVPWLPGGTTRSATQGLIDLTGDSTIDLSDVTFDSNAQINFDGTNDHIELAQDSKWFTDEWAYEFVFKSDSNNGVYQGVIWAEGAVQSGYSGYQKLFALYNHSYFHYRIHNTVTSWTNTNYTPSNYTPTNYNHIVWQFANGTTNIAINGEIVHTDSSRGTYNGGTTSPLFIGARNDLNYELNGQIPYFKRYSRLLTISEIKANYNAVKGRFNI